MLEITRVNDSAFAEIWPIFQSIVATGDTFVYAPDITQENAKDVWFAPNFQTYVAKDNGKTVGAYVIRPNHRDLGDHIANAAYIVSADARRMGVARRMAKHSFVEAKKAGYSAMQFNFVVSTNEIAVQLWQSVGFKIIGTVPDAYRHQQLNKQVDIYIMYRAL